MAGDMKDVGEGISGVSQQLLGRVAIKSRQIRPGAAFAAEVKKDQLLQIMTVGGGQVSDFVAFDAGDHRDRLSVAVTRVKNNSIMIQQGHTIYSNRRNPLLELVEDTVGRHDMLFAMCDPRRYADDFNQLDHASCQTGLVTALAPWSIGADDFPDPINWFMHVGILARGELEIRESIAEANDFVMLRAITDTIVGVTACPQDQNATNAFAPSDILVRIFA
jgi:uncharacterized protein YcgI (DUF1989 family)